MVEVAVFVVVDVVCVLLSILVRVSGPKYPAGGSIPFAFWYAASAAWVCEPKYPVAPAGMLKLFVSRKFCSAVTSSPVFPTVRSRVYEYVGAVVVLVVPVL